MSFLQCDDLPLVKCTDLFLYLNHSPCSDCANELLKLIQKWSGKITVYIRFKNLYRTTGRNSEKVKSKNILGLRSLCKATDNRVEVISNEHWLTLFKFIRLNKWENTQFTTSSFVTHLANRIKYVAKHVQNVSPKGVLHNYQLLINKWIENMTPIDDLINDIFDKNDRTVKKLRCEYIRREYKNLIAFKSMNNMYDVSTKQVMLPLVMLCIPYTVEHMFDIESYHSNVEALNKYKSA